MAYNNTGIEPIEPLTFRQPGGLSSASTTSSSKSSKTEVKKPAAKPVAKKGAAFK